MHRWMWMRIFLAADGGGEGGTSGGGDGGGSPTPAPAPTEGKQGQPAGNGGGGKPGDDLTGLPSYFGQLSPDKRMNQEYRDALGKFAKLEDLADAYVENERHKGDYIKRLTKDSTDEEVKAWAKEMGIPETKDGYKFAGDDQVTEPTEKGMINAWKEVAWKNGLSTRQAEQAWAFVKGIGIVGAARQAKALDEAKKSFDGRLTELYKAETASDKDAQDKAKAAAGLFARFGSQTGIGKALVDSGLAYDPAFVKAVASYVGSHDPQMAGSGTTVGSGNTPQGYGAFGTNYSESSKRVLGIK